MIIIIIIMQQQYIKYIYKQNGRWESSYCSLLSLTI